MKIQPIMEAYGHDEALKCRQILFLYHQHDENGNIRGVERYDWQLRGVKLNG